MPRDPELLKAFIAAMACCAALIVESAFGADSTALPAETLERACVAGSVSETSFGELLIEDA